MPADNRQAAFGPEPTVTAGRARAAAEGHRAGDSLRYRRGGCWERTRENPGLLENAAAAQRPLTPRRTRAHSAISRAPLPPLLLVHRSARGTRPRATYRPRQVPAAPQPLQGPARPSLSSCRPVPGPLSPEFCPIRTSLAGNTATVLCDGQCPQAPASPYTENSMSWGEREPPAGSDSGGLRHRRACGTLPVGDGRDRATGVPEQLPAFVLGV